MHHSQPTPNNLGLYRLEGFSGRKEQLLTLHEWMTGGDDLPAICISGEQGVGKSTLATAAAWNHIHDFSDGIIRVAAAGTNRLRLYDIVRTMDSVFGTTLTRFSKERWGISILEQLYRRKRLLIVDDLSGMAEEDLDTLVDIISHLHHDGGDSRVVLIDRNFSSGIAKLVQFQFLHLEGLSLAGVREFVDRRAPDPVKAIAQAHIEALHEHSSGHPFLLRVMLGLLLDYSWDEVLLLVQDIAGMAEGEWQDSGLSDNEPSSGVLVSGGVEQPATMARTPAFIKCANLVTVAIENLAMMYPDAGPFLNRLTRAAGGASLSALRNLFWSDLGSQEGYEETLNALLVRGLVDTDLFQQRLTMHPIVRRYLSQNVVMLGEDWERNHARYYVHVADEYLRSPLERWPEIDIEWGNIYSGADWCEARLRRLWQQHPLEILQDKLIDSGEFVLAVESQELREDLQLTRSYALSIAHYAFWRHPPNTMNWLAAGAVACLSLRDMRNYGWLLLSMGRQAFFRSQVEDALQWLTRAERLFEAHDFLEELIYAHTDIGTSLRILDKPRQALNHFNAAFETICELGNPQSLATAYMNLGSAHYSLNNFEQAIAKHRKALRVAQRQNNRHAIASAYNNMGLAAEGMEHLVDAQQAYQQALEEFRRLNNSAGISISYNNLGAVYYANNNLSEATKWYGLDLTLSEAQGNWTDMAATLHNLGHVALDSGDLQRAKEYFTQSRDLYAAFELIDYVAEEEELLKYIDEQHAAVET
ncbi:MAG: tetratricopeptide repeat protein [Chloroflexota bacterium]